MADPKDLQSRIAARAYHIWEGEGRPHGRDQEHWRMAEAELAPMTAKTTPTVTANPVTPPAPLRRPSLLRGRKPPVAPAPTVR